MNHTQTINPVVNFMEHFTVEADSLASQVVLYDEEKGIFYHGEADVYGETAIVRVKTTNGNQVLELSGRNEEELIEELSEVFAEFNNDSEAFIKVVQEKYKDANQI